MELVAFVILSSKFTFKIQLKKLNKGFFEKRSKMNISLRIFTCTLNEGKTNQKISEILNLNKKVNFCFTEVKHFALCLLG